MKQVNRQLEQVIGISNRFRMMIRKKQGQDLPTWLDRVAKSGIRPLIRFAQGLNGDLAAVSAALSVHWPVNGMNLTEMMCALNEVVESGKAKLIGCCNFLAYLLSSANTIAVENHWAKLAFNQVAYNLNERGV